MLAATSILSVEESVLASDKRNLIVLKVRPESEEREDAAWTWLINSLNLMFDPGVG